MLLFPSPIFMWKLKDSLSQDPSETTVKERLSWPQHICSYVHVFPLSIHVLIDWIKKNTITVQFWLFSCHLEKKFYLLLSHYYIILDVPAGNVVCGKIVDLGFLQKIHSLNSSSISDQCLLALVSSFIKKKKGRKTVPSLSHGVEINGDIYSRFLGQKK